MSRPGLGREQTRLLELVSDYTKEIRCSPHLVHTRGPGDPYPSPTEGTTATTTPNKHGIYAKPVYYDWGANWDRVRELVPGEDVQRALEISLQHAADKEHYCFAPYDPRKIWPWLFHKVQRFGDGQQDELMNQYLPRDTIRTLNAKMADYLQEQGERWIRENPIRREDDEDDDVDDEEILQKRVSRLWEEKLSQELFRLSTSSPFAGHFTEECEAALYDPHREQGFREKLIMCISNPYAFMPLNYMLAKLLSPPHTELRIYSSNKYSVVHDVTHNILFDNFWYFSQETPVKALAASKDALQLSDEDFDYTLGGIREPYTVRLSRHLSSLSPLQRRLLRWLTERTDEIRQDRNLFTWSADDSMSDSYPSPTQGTTATSTPNQDGVYKTPVYYDWGANWNRVKSLVPGQQVQQALKMSLEQAANNYYFAPYDKDTIWPWLFNLHRRLGNGEEHGILNSVLPDSTIREKNSYLADLHQAAGERWIIENAVLEEDNHEEYLSEEDNDESYEDYMYDELEDTLMEYLWDIPGVERWKRDVRAIVYDPDNENGVREKLIMCISSSYAFMPLNYTLAKLLSPPDTELRIYSSNKYSVVHDVTHNILFDNFWYFVRVTAEKTLAEAKDHPQESAHHFDYTLGGLRELDWTDPALCETCGRAAESASHFARCSRCKKVMYCGETCQKRHWKEHKKTCRPVSG